jgi:hypothetical protein
LTATSEQKSTVIEYELFERLAHLVVKNGGQAEPEYMQRQYHEALLRRKAHPGQHVVIQKVASAELTVGGETNSFDVGPFDISFMDIFSLGVHGQFTPGADWSFVFEASLEAFGNTIWKTDAVVSPENTSITYSPNAGLVKAEITVGVFGGNHCVRVFGKGCYWKPFSWDCADFNETFGCFN